MKHTLFIILLVFIIPGKGEAQVKEALQMGTLSPALWVLSSDGIEDYQKMHYTFSTIIYMGSYMVTESEWKAVLITLLLGVTKEVVYDAFLNKGEPLWDDMKWNALGMSQGLVFTLSLRL